jgi:hypothetical protein
LPPEDGADVFVGFRDYADAILALPAMRAWVADALAECERIELFEVYE